MVETQRRCDFCQAVKPIEEFYKHPKGRNGYQNNCKECMKVKARENRAKNIHYYRKYDRKRGNRMTAEDLRKQRKRNPKRTRAHNLVSKAVKAGKLKKEPCVICGKEEVHAHHEDYSKPLDIVWLCPRHHAAIHAQPN